MRWASLLPAATAWVYALGRERHLVARSHLCQVPTRVQALPICTRVSLEGPAEPWERVLGPYLVDVGTLAAVRPDGVLTVWQETAELEASVAIEAFQKAIGYPIRVFSFGAKTWEAYLATISRLGEALEALPAAQKHLKQQKQRYERLLGISQRIANPVSMAVLWVEGQLPVHQGSWAEACGDWLKLALPLSSGAFERGPLSWEQLQAADPEVILIARPSATLREAGEALAQWSRLPAIQTLTAYRKKRLYAMEGRQALFWPGPNLVASFEALYELAHTPHYRFNVHLGTLWAPLL